MMPIAVDQEERNYGQHMLNRSSIVERATVTGFRRSLKITQQSSKRLLAMADRSSGESGAKGSVKKVFKGLSSKKLPTPATAKTVEATDGNESVSRRQMMGYSSRTNSSKFNGLDLMVNSTTSTSLSTPMSALSQTSAEVDRPGPEMLPHELTSLAEESEGLSTSISVGAAKTAVPLTSAAESTANVSTVENQQSFV